MHKRPQTVKENVLYPNTAGDTVSCLILFSCFTQSTDAYFLMVYYSWMASRTILWSLHSYLFKVLEWNIDARKLPFQFIFIPEPRSTDISMTTMEFTVDKKFWYAIITHPCHMAIYIWIPCLVWLICTSVTIKKFSITMLKMKNVLPYWSSIIYAIIKFWYVKILVH